MWTVVASLPPRPNHPAAGPQTSSSLTPPTASPSTPQPKKWSSGNVPKTAPLPSWTGKAESAAPAHARREYERGWAITALMETAGRRLKDRRERYRGSSRPSRRPTLSIRPNRRRRSEMPDLTHCPLYPLTVPNAPKSWSAHAVTKPSAIHGPPVPSAEPTYAPEHENSVMV